MTILSSYPKSDGSSANPALESASYALQKTDLVKINEVGVKAAATYIQNKLKSEAYTPRTWRTHPLHLIPPSTYSETDPGIKATLDWIFLVSSLNFSFWSEKEGRPDRYSVEWRQGWRREEMTVWTGYWSLLAAINRALEENIPFTDPTFYASEELCPDSLIEHIFRPSPQSSETIPLLPERIRVLREVGSILRDHYDGSFQGFICAFHERHGSGGTALQLVQMVTKTFPSFKDETIYEGRPVCFWKRAQILVAETWAAFYPNPKHTLVHPVFPGPAGPRIHELTMFADYRVPQVLHHLRILTYSPSLIDRLISHEYLEHGSREEVGIRAASIIGVERVRQEINARLDEVEKEGEVSSVLIDFYLWDLAKRIEKGEESVEGVSTTEAIPAHRTRSIWY